MNDPLDALRLPATPVEPDPIFAVVLRERLRRALQQVGGSMTEVAQETTHEAAPAWPPTLTPYITVRDARQALAWYTDVFAATRRGEMYVMPDGSIGHAELGIGDAVLMLSEGSDAVPVQPPAADQRTFSHSLHVQVPDVDATVALARDKGAQVEREPRDEPYGRVAVIVDPFGHRWMLTKPPAWATRPRHGDIGYVTLGVPDDDRARAFYGAVLGWRFEPGSVPRGWNVAGVQPMVGLAGGTEPAETHLCYRVSDAAAAARLVDEHGGRAGEVERKPYGLFSDCVDDQGIRFQLWQPVD